MTGIKSVNKCMQLAKCRLWKGIAITVQPSIIQGGSKRGCLFKVCNRHIFWHRTTFHISNCSRLVCRMSPHLNILCTISAFMSTYMGVTNFEQKRSGVFGPPWSSCSVDVYHQSVIHTRPLHCASCTCFPLHWRQKCWVGASRVISWNLTTQCLSVTGSGSIGECGRLSQPSRLLGEL